MDSAQVVGRAPTRLSLSERACLTGKWVAFEVYTPATRPLKRIAVVGARIEECVAELTRQGLDPRHFEYVLY
jgi:hypothetical protein